MVILPDYPDRAIAAERIRVERALLFCQMGLISTGALWLFASFGSDSGPLFRFGPVTILFSTALLMPDLVEFGPLERTRISTACCITWPPLLAFSEVNRYNLTVSGYTTVNLGGLLGLIFVTAVLFFYSRKLLQLEANSKRWRGLSTTVGFGLAIPIVAINTSPQSWLIVFVIALITTLPSLMAKDGSEEVRELFYDLLKKTERSVLEAQSGNNLMQQPNSLLKMAREEGRKDPERGLSLVYEAQREADRIQSFVEDLREIRDQSEIAVNRAEEKTGFPGEARHVFQTAVEELDNGSLRSAEQSFRNSKIMAEKIELHWESAKIAIADAEEAVGSETGHLVAGLRSTVEAAKKAMEDEDPEYAIAIVSAIPTQMGDVEGLMSRASRSIEDAERAILSSDSDFSIDAKDRIKEAKEAMESGNASLAIGLAEGVMRSLRSEGEAQSSVQRALRQRKSIEASFPSGEDGPNWLARLEEVESLANSQRWLEAADSMSNLTSDLDSLLKRLGEAREMLDFLSEDWKKLRKRLDSSGIGPESSNRLVSERALASSEEALSEGKIEECLAFLGEADSAMESLRCLV
ncbi:MAG: hypothetical protein CMA88_03585 [Euryarchaeota archaeon]|nr:hypothetical protein [Euryarchaeota archaeon]